MKKPMTKQEQCLYIMNMSRFSYQQKIDSQIWAAKQQKCRTCHAEPFTPCLNSTDIKAGRSKPRINKTPHQLRVNWDLLLRTLRDKGYS